MGEILFLAHRIPFPPDRGDKIRSHHFLRALASRAPVHVGTFAETDKDREAEYSLAELAASHCLLDRNSPLVIAGANAILRSEPVSLTAFRDKRLSRWIERTLAAHPIDTIFVFSGQMGQYIPKEFCGRVVVDLCDVDSEKFATYAEDAPFPQSLIYSREARLLRREEGRLADLADRTLLISQQERDLFTRCQNGDYDDCLCVVGNGIDSEFFDPARVEERDGFDEGVPHFVFTGQMDYAPNVAAVRRFASSILPRLRTQGDARFHIVGRAPSDEVRALEKLEGVKVWGEVPDVRPYLASATAVVAPLMLARGVQNKVLEAMAMARPVLLSEEAATGIEAQDGRHFDICADDGAFVEAARRSWSDPEGARQMGHEARDFVMARMSWASVSETLSRIAGLESRGTKHAA